MITGGTIGEIFAALSFAGALTGTAGFFFAEKQPLQRKSWSLIGSTGLFAHIAGVLGVIVTLFILIYTHNYRYHYVYSHSSNELPFYYMLSCFWEGQEGSFLLWSFWHSILAGVIWLRGGEWRNIVLAVICSVELILSSMILGIYMDETAVSVLFGLLILAPMVYIGWKWVKAPSADYVSGIFRTALAVTALMGILMLIRGQEGFLDNLLKGRTGGINTLAFSAAAMLWLASFGVFIWHAWKQISRRRADGYEILSGATLLAVVFLLLRYSLDIWKIGSTPFLTLAEAMPEAPVFQLNPDFIPANGSGLNPLLQNYWMVIHPPTLFLGFASTVVPFAFLVGGLFRKKFSEWIRPAMPWLIFSVMVLGVGIIMGGYWAYETLNFGGYWNWDPVENSSFVPWLFGIAALHSILVFRKKGNLLGISMVLVVMTFLFVLYSTFLTRSGILGESSVHTFTDLGLSGQLLALLFVYLIGVIVLFVVRLPDLPSGRSVSVKFWSAEFLLLAGTLAMLFAGFGIIMTTSLPVFNKIFGLSLAPPAHVQFFYYEWNVWFAVMIAGLSGLAVWFFWIRENKDEILNKIFKPFLTSLLLTAVIVALIAFVSDWTFTYNETFRENYETGMMSVNVIRKGVAFIGFHALMIADELLLAAGIFMVLSNVVLMVRLIRKYPGGSKIMGGTLSHVGFGLMLIGMLFSSGYDQVMSINVNPDELAFMSEDSRADNIILMKEQTKSIKDYDVTYVGKKEAQAPVDDIRIIEESQGMAKLRFEDATGDEFALTIPVDPFQSGGELDQEKIRDFLNEKIELIKPPHINERSLYGLVFTKRENKDKQFLLYPEAEANMGGLISHPSRKILWDKDIYVSVSVIPDPDQEAEYKAFDLKMSIGDTAFTDHTIIVLEKLINLPAEGNIDLKVQANLRVMSKQGAEYVATPVYLINNQNQVGFQEYYAEQTDSWYTFYDINPENEQMSIRIEERSNPEDDYVAIKVSKKPLINILWLGTFLLTAGFIMALIRRIKENKRTA